MTREEVDDLSIEISMLTPLEPIAAEEVVVGRHGLLLVHGSSSGLLLPQVATHRGWTREEYLMRLS